MKIAIIFGRYSSQIHGTFPIMGLGKTVGLTGSESFYFNSVRGLAERGHTVVAYCDCDVEVQSAAHLGGAEVARLEQLPRVDATYDAVISFNEPNYLRSIPQECLRVCNQQLNDFESHYCAPGYDDYVDAYTFASRKHRYHMISVAGRILHQKAFVMSNCIDLAAFEGVDDVKKEPGSVVYTSSPDRGLHWALRFFPLIRARVPHATLKVYYRYQQWSDAAKGMAEETGTRARYLNECFDRLGRNGENGVYLIDSVPNAEMVKILARSEVLLYPCDPIRHTEGFSVSILDAIAAGCQPVISDADAIGDVYGGIATIIGGYPETRAEDWIEAVSSVLKGHGGGEAFRTSAAKFVQSFDYKLRAEQWEKFLQGRIAYKRSGC